MKIGFRKDGQILAVDMFSVCNSGAYDAQNDGASVGPHCVTAVSASGHALARRLR